MYAVHVMWLSLTAKRKVVKVTADIALLCFLVVEGGKMQVEEGALDKRERYHGTDLRHRRTCYLGHSNRVHPLQPVEKSEPVY